MPIRLLDPEVAQKIAAGEVVERPASVVKELVENSLDAGACSVQVEIRGGGLNTIRVVDDGHGIPSGEVELAFLRHATSKLRTADDLSAIRTLGFRGEALASIAAVSQVVLYTRHADEDLGVNLTIEAGQVVERKPWAGAPGTTISVRNLFFNVPARLKFMRTATGEAGQIGHLIEQFALGHPSVRFRFVNDGRRVLDTPGTGDLRDALRSVFGSAIADRMLPIESTSESAHLRVWGLVSLPDQNRATRSALCFFINGRRITNPSLAYALEEAYRPALPMGRHPIVALHLEIPADEVDCNVHPAKLEVRLVHDRAVNGALHRAVRAALMQVAPVPEVSAPLATAAWPSAFDWFESRLANLPAAPTISSNHLTSTNSPTVANPTTPFAAPPSPIPSPPNPQHPTPTADSPFPSSLPPAPNTPDPTPDSIPPPPSPFVPTALRPVGQVQNTYIVAEGPGGVYFIDQHTAHERILYEEILAQRSAPDQPTQELLSPLVVPLNARQRAALSEHGDSLGHLGFRFEEFGPDAFALRGVPLRLVKADLAQTLRDAAEVLAGDPVGPDGFDRVAATLACHAAVRAGDSLTPEEIRVLLARLEQTDINRYCPHGRPIVIHLPTTQLEKDFHRR